MAEQMIIEEQRQRGERLLQDLAPHVVVVLQHGHVQLRCCLPIRCYGLRVTPTGSGTISVNGGGSTTIVTSGTTHIVIFLQRRRHPDPRKRHCARQELPLGHDHSGIPYPTATTDGNGAMGDSTTGLSVSLIFDAGGSMGCSAARIICGTPTASGISSVTIYAVDSNATRARLNRKPVPLSYGEIGLAVDEDDERPIYRAPRLDRTWSDSRS